MRSISGVPGLGPISDPEEPNPYLESSAWDVPNPEEEEETETQSAPIGSTTVDVEHIGCIEWLPGDDVRPSICEPWLRLSKLPSLALPRLGMGLQ